MDIKSFRVYCLKDRSKAVSEIEYYLEDSVIRSTILRVINVWINPIDDKILKAHMTTDLSGIEGIDFSNIDNGVWGRMYNGNERIIKVSLSRTSNHDDCIVVAKSSVNSVNFLIRYGMNYVNSRAKISYTDKFGGGNIHIFENKSCAIEELLNNVSYETMVAGTELVNFNEVSDEILESIGMVKISPFLKSHSNDMWICNFSKMIGTSYYNRKETSNKLIEPIIKEVSLHLSNKK